MSDYKSNRKVFMENRIRARRLANNIGNHSMNEFITLLMDNQCGSDVLENGWTLFCFELHCSGTVEVIAKKVNGRWVVRSSSMRSY